MKLGRKANIQKRIETMTILEKEFGQGATITRKQMVVALENAGIDYKDVLSRIVFIITDTTRKAGKNQYKLGMSVSSEQPQEQPKEQEFVFLTKEEYKALEFKEQMAYSKKRKAFLKTQEQQKEQVAA